MDTWLMIERKQLEIMVTNLRLFSMVPMSSIRKASEDDLHPNYEFIQAVAPLSLHHREEIARKWTNGILEIVLLTAA